MTKSTQFAREWLSVLMNSDRGRTFLCNLSCDVATGRIDTPTLTRFMEYAGDPDLDCGVINGAFSRVDSATAQADLFRKGPTATDLPPMLATVKKFDRTFCRLYLDGRKFHGLPSFLDDPALFKHLNIGNLKLVARKGAELRGQKPLVWLTFAKDIQAVVADLEAQGKKDEIPSRIRDLLGLNHYFQDEFLVQILVPKEAFGSHAISRPLSLDAGCNLIFRTNLTDHHCGRTVDLAAVTEGASEVVTDPLPVELAMDIVALGTLVRTPPQFSWRSVWTMDDVIQSELDALLRQIETFVAAW